MKTKLISMILALIIAGCTGPPKRPNTMDIINKIHNREITLGQLNQLYADYDQARAEYEQSTEWKIIQGSVLGLGFVGSCMTPAYSGYGTVTTKTKSDGHSSSTTTYSVWGY